MASSVDIVPSLGQGLSFLQEGPGASPGYGAIDRRRMLVAAGVREGIVHENAYKVTAPGTGPTVDVDADAGMVNIQGDSVAQQGIYTVAPHSSDITLDIAPGHATLPRNDLVILEVLDDDHDSGGLNKSRVRVLPGTPTSGAVLTDAFGAHGTPTPGNNQFPLALVNVPALDATITAGQVDDRRYRTAGVTTIATNESRTNVAYGLLATPDIVRNLVLPADGLIVVAYKATWQESIAANASAAIFLGANQLKLSTYNNAAAIATAASTGSGTAAVDGTLVTAPHGLVSQTRTTNYSGDVTTGQAIAASVGGAASAPLGGVCAIEAAAGIYDIGVQFKALSGSVTARDRKLRAWTQPFPA
jgi:hypothetical protein